MIVYLAGIFDFLLYPEKEKMAMEHAHSLDLEYNRLVSFFESHRINGVLQLKKEFDDGTGIGHSGTIGEIETSSTGDCG